MATEIIQAGSRLSVTTQNAVIRKALKAAYPKEYFLSNLMSKGRFRARCGGPRCEWRMEKRIREPEPVDGYPEGPTSYPSTNFWTEASLPWRKYRMPERIDEFEKLAQQRGGAEIGAEVIIPIVEAVLTKLPKDFTFGLAKELFKDGNSGAANRIHGLESMFSVNSCVSDSAFGNPNDTYAGVSTALGAFGGTWTAGSGYGWPHGTGDLEYYFASPLVCDYNNTLLTPSTSTGVHRWADQWESAIRMATTWADVLGRGPADALLLDPELFRIARDSLQERTRFIAKAPPENMSVGWKEYDFEGVSIVTEQAVTTDCGYLIRFADWELRSMQGQLIETKKEYDLDSDSDAIMLRSYVQLARVGAPPTKLAGISVAGT